MTGAGRSRHRSSRTVERSAVWAFGPVVAMLPFTLLALAALCVPIRLFMRVIGVDISFWLTFVWVVGLFAASSLLLFVRSFQLLVLSPVLHARRPDENELVRISSSWGDVAAANGLPPDRYVLRILDSDELNAFACGGHLVVVTSLAARDLSEPQLRGVLAHELSHHLGSHTVAITIGQWMSIPVILLARIGFFFENVAHAAAGSFGRHNAGIAAAGKVAALVIGAFSWIFTSGLRAGDALGNIVGHESEFEADKRVVRMGFGPELASALRYVLATGSGRRPVGWRARLAASHPSARTRVARIEAFSRHPAR